MIYLIPIISSALYRLGGWHKGNKWFRWGMGIPIALITWNFWYILTYLIATNVFSYGENHPITKVIGKANWFVSGFMFGLASLNITNALWSGCVMVMLMWLSNEGYEGKKLDHKFVELGLGFLGTLIFVFG